LQQAAPGQPRQTFNNTLGSGRYYPQLTNPFMSPGLMSPNPYNSDIEGDKGYPRFRTLS